MFNVPIPQCLFSERIHLLPSAVCCKYYLFVAREYMFCGFFLAKSDLSSDNTCQLGKLSANMQYCTCGFNYGNNVEHVARRIFPLILYLTVSGGLVYAPNYIILNKLVFCVCNFCLT